MREKEKARLDLAVGVEKALAASIPAVLRHGSSVPKEANAAEMGRIRAVKSHAAEAFKPAHDKPHQIYGPSHPPTCRIIRSMPFPSRRKALKFARRKKKAKHVVFVQVLFRGNVSEPYRAVWGHDPYKEPPPDAKRRDPKDYTFCCRAFGTQYCKCSTPYMREVAKKEAIEVIATHNPHVWKSLRWTEEANFQGQRSVLGREELARRFFEKAKKEYRWARLFTKNGRFTVEYGN